MNNLTAQQLKEFSNNEENVKLVKSLFEAIAFSDLITEIVENKANEILNFYKFETEEERYNERIIPSEVVTEQKNAFLLKQDDWDLYFKELESFYYSDDCPVKPTKKGHCPALEAQSFVREIKVQIANFFAPALGINYNQISGNLKFYKDYYDLILRIFAPQVKQITQNV
jgi:hypothetical protein